MLIHVGRAGESHAISELHDSQVHTVMVEKKLGEVVNRLNKTKVERKPNLRAEREERDRQERMELRMAQEEEVRMMGAVDPPTGH